MSQNVRYYEPGGKSVLDKDEELWRRLSVTPIEGLPTATLPADDDKKDNAAVDDSALVDTTFNALVAAKAELQLLHGLVNQLEAQTSLGVTYVPDMRSADDFHFHSNKQKLIKAEEKRQQMKDAASILQDVHKALSKQIKQERTFYRELMGLSFFHNVCIQSTVLSPFSVDLSVCSGWDVPLVQDVLVLDIQADAEGHVSLGDDIPQPALEYVRQMLDATERHRPQAMRENDEIHNLRMTFREEYRKQKDAAERQKRASDSQRGHQLGTPESSQKRRRLRYENASITLPTSSLPELERKEDDTKEEEFMKRVRSLQLDPEDEKVIANCGEGESDSTSEGSASDFAVSESLREDWFSREELIRMMRVHMALCDLQKGNLWQLFKKTLERQASSSNLTPMERFHFNKALHDMDRKDASALGLRTEMFGYFLRCVYRLPPFLESIDIRDISISRNEKLLILGDGTSRTGADAETNDEESRVVTIVEENEEWLTKLRPHQLFQYRFRETAPRLESLLPTFLQAILHQQLLHNVIWPALDHFPSALTKVARAPSIGASQIDVTFRKQFRGSIVVDASGILIYGEFLREGKQHRLPPITVEKDQFEHVLREMLK